MPNILRELMSGINRLPDLRDYEGEVIGMEKGIEIGIEQTTKTIALKLIQQGSSFETIAAVTGLSIKAIQQLINTQE